MSNANQLKEYLMEDYKRTEEILNEAGFYNVIYNPIRREFRCAIEYGSNPTSVCINQENMTGTIFSKNVSGDIFEILKYKKDCTFVEAIKFVEETLNISTNFYYKKPELYNGYYKRFKNIYDVQYENEDEETSYDNDELKRFIQVPSKLFLNDGISYKTQKEFNVCYDEESSRIIVPWYDANGNLVGAEGRYNSENMDNLIEMPKWFPVLRFSKGKYLFGEWQNKKYLQSTNEIFVFESSKSVMLMSQCGYRNVVSTGGKNITEDQVLGLIKYPAKTVVICFDKDVTENEIKCQCEKFMSYLFFKKNVFYLIDEEDLLDEKDAPIDKGVAIFKKLNNNRKFYG